jgi:cation diffusion facilitator CzcD-associated flavoprotein CzcO
VHDVAIIGAGPYGLSAAAHLRHAGVDTVVFGDPMASWDGQMPRGMLLRSTRRSSSISDPERALTLERFEAWRGSELPRPIPVETFVDYGRWFQQRVTPDLDRRLVRRVEPDGETFRLVLDDGERVPSRRVVVACGLTSFAHTPRILASLPERLVVHSRDLGDAAEFADRRVLVVGAGQSALESAALLHEGGANVELVARADRIGWIPIGTNGNGAARSLLNELLFPPTEVGPPGINWVAGAPDVFRRLPASVRAEITRRCTVPVGASWLTGRLADVSITTSRSIVSATARNGGAWLVLDDGTRRDVEHVLAATGYRVDMTRSPVLAPELTARLCVTGGGYPELGTGFEASVPRLYFLGAAAVGSFGPVMRFVAGTWFSAPALARTILGRPPKPLSFSW